MLNKSKGNMYPFVTHTWNTVKGRCPHDCSYCYMKKWRDQKELHFDESELKTDLGEGNFIFVGSSCDMWAWKIPEEWIKETLGYCAKFYNGYLFQSKNPMRFKWFYRYFFDRDVLGTTIESNREYNIYSENCPTVTERFCEIGLIGAEGFRVMVTIEPIMDFDTKELVEIIEDIGPEWVNIGADSQSHKLPEPPKEKVLELIAELEIFTEVKLKKNLNRLIGNKRAE